MQRRFILKQRRFHTDTRTSENFTKKGLETLTGVNTSSWITYMVKELVDNSLEACDKPDIEITAKLDIADRVESFSVRDNGRGISEEQISKIFCDIERFGGTKRHYKLLTRGNQGNALMTVLGIQNLLNSRLRIQSNDALYTVNVKTNDLLGTPEVVIEKEQAEEDISGLEVNLDLSNNTEYRVGDVFDIKNTFFNFIELNPHVNFRLNTIAYDERTDSYKFECNGDKDNKLNLGKNNTTGKVIWFSSQDFLDRFKADVRVNRNIGLLEWIQEFCDLSSRRKATSVLKKFNSENGSFDKIGNFFSENGQVKNNEAISLYQKMCKATKRFSESGLDKTLGSIGQEGMKHGLIESLKLSGKYEDVKKIVDASVQRGLKIKDIDDLIVYYSKGEIAETNKVIPFYFELIAIPLSKEKTFSYYRKIEETFGINQSFIYDTPSVDLQLKHKNGKEKTYSSIREPFYRLGYGFKVVCNLMCPTVDFKTKGKQGFDTTPFTETITEVVGKAVRKIERDIIPALNKLNESEEDYEETELLNKAYKGFIKDFVFDNFMNVYKKATNNGRYTITQRQFYYAMRPLFLNTIEKRGYEYTWDSKAHKKKKLELEYSTFCSYIDDYEVNILGERIIFKKDRGFFVEPHSGRNINLGTESVRRYYPDLRQYNNLLFVEKSGFYELLHKDFELTKRYDIGLINSEGYANNATRDLIEKIQREKPDIKLYVLTDFDIDGLGIAKNVKEADDLSAVDIFDCERLGVTLEDIRLYDLSTEPVEYAKSKLSELENRYNDGEISKEVYEFLKAGQRVEINAFTPVELKEYLEAKFKEAGIEKLKPESEDDIDTFTAQSVESIRSSAIDEAIGRWIRNQCSNKLSAFLNDSIDFRNLGTIGEDIFEGIEDDETEAQKEKRIEPELRTVTDNQAKTIYDTIMSELENFPPKSWYDLNDEEKGKVRDEFDNLKLDYKSEIKKEAQRLLDDCVYVDIEIQDNGDMTKSTNREIELHGYLKHFYEDRLKFTFDQLLPVRSKKVYFGHYIYSKAEAINEFGEDKVERALNGDIIECSVVCGFE